MNITVLRDTYTSLSVTSEVLLDDVQRWYGIEPPNRPGPKPYCIPAATYKVILAESVHFGMQVPCIQDVPGFTGIEIHPGNFPRNTHGCLCIGEGRAVDDVTQSRAAFDELMSLLRLDPDNIFATYIGGTV